MSHRAAVAALLLLLGACTSGSASAPATPPPTASSSPSAPPAAPAPSTPSTPPTPSGPSGRVVARIDDEVVPEASGVEHGLRDPDVIWVLDDGPEVRGLYATSPGRGPLGLVEVEGIAGGDTEALAAGRCARDDPRPCLFVGDIGDNQRRRDGVRVLRVREPDLGEGMPSAPLPADVARFTYPDGPHDAEAMFTVDGRLFVVTKAVYDEEERRAGPTELFEAPRFADGPLVARGSVPVPMPRDPLLALVVGNVVVGADAGEAGVILRTYDHAVVFRPPTPDGDPSGFPGWSVVAMQSAGTLQTEGVAFAGDDCAHDTVGERDAAVWRTPCLAAGPVAP